MRWRSFRNLAVRATAACALAACAATQQEPEQAEASPLPAEDVNPPKIAKEMPSYEVRLTLLEAGEPLEGCNVPAPHFFYDEAYARPQDHLDLQAFAECLNSPAYEKLKILLVGRADVRGPDEYNEDLGRERAEYTKLILEHYGVASDRMLVMTEGEADAMGAEGMYSHGWDRRTDLVSLNLVHAPR